MLQYLRYVDEVGLDVSHHSRIFPRGGEKLFFLTSFSQDE